MAEVEGADTFFPFSSGLTATITIPLTVTAKEWYQGTSTTETINVSLIIENDIVTNVLFEKNRVNAPMSEGIASRVNYVEISTSTLKYYPTFISKEIGQLAINCSYYDWYSRVTYSNTCVISFSSIDAFDTISECINSLQSVGYQNEGKPMGSVLYTSGITITK